MQIAPRALGLRGNRWPSEIVPLGLIVAMITVAGVWNRWENLSWQPALVVWFAGPAVLLAVSAVYTFLRPAPVIAEIGFYAALWLLYPVFATRLTYLSFAAGYSLNDTALDNVDAAVGFHWLQWAKFTIGHPLFLAIQQFGYLSHAWQPVLTIPVLAIYRPRRGNAKFLTTMLVAMLLTISIAMFTPAIGPPASLGMETEWAPIIRTLRETHGAQNLPYVGIVNFPSFHTVMAILFVEAHLGLRWSLPPVLALNVLMLLAIPYCGAHYLADVAGGFAVAICAIGMVRCLAPSAFSCGALQANSASSPDTVGTAIVPKAAVRHSDAA